MDKPSKLNERLTLIANLSVVVGIIFLAVELRQNTQAIQAQTRDSLTEKQMLLTEWFNNPESAALITKVQSLGVGELDEVELNWWTILAAGNFREWENSYYQYQRGLFTREDFEPRVGRWRSALASPAWRSRWDLLREGFAPSFRAEIERIVAEVGG